MKSLLVYCFFLFSLLVFWNCDSKSVFNSCGSRFCTIKGGDEIQQLDQNTSIPKDSIHFVINLIWVHESDSYSVLNYHNIKNSILNSLNQAFAESNLFFSFIDSTQTLVNKSLSIEKIYNNGLAEYCLKTNGDSQNISLFIVPSKGVLNGYTRVLRENFHLYRTTNSYNAIFISHNAILNGSTLAHEFGHFFGLQHTFGESTEPFSTKELPNKSNCNFAGDRICDTPADPNLKITSCESSSDFAETGYRPITENFMSYYPNECKKSFTLQQKVVMHKFAYLYRR